MTCSSVMRARIKKSLWSRWQRRFRLEGARALLEQALASDLENLGEAHPKVAIRRSNLAGVLKDLGDLEGAKDMAHKAVKIAALQPEGSLIRTRVQAAMKNILASS